MKRIFRRILICIAATLCMLQYGLGQLRPFYPDLSAIKDTTKWGNIDREVKFDSVLVFSALASEGPVWLKEYSLANGKIEVDIRGKDLQGQSFVGVAFHLADGKTYDAIYFRPFNFLNAERNSHSVQYISMPGHPWQQLRQDFPGKYESRIANPPDPDGWFHVTIEIVFPIVRVFVNHEEMPSLTVQQLSTRKAGSVGLWVGYKSEGEFRNLKITSYQD